MINIFSLLLSLLNNAYFISYIKSKTFDLPLTFKEEQFYLQKKCNGDKAARDLLIEKNLRLVAHIAKNIITIEICKKISFQLALLDLLKPSIVTVLIKKPISNLCFKMYRK